MGRSNRRKKIAKLLRKAKQRREIEAKKMEDPATVAGQSICSVETLEQHARDQAALKHMLQEEVMVNSEEVVAEVSSQSWLAAAWNYVFATST